MVKKAACIFIAKVVDGQTYVLTATRRNQPNNYNLIGGKVDPGETPRDAIKREAFEEANIQLKSLELLYVEADADGYECFCYVGQFDGIPQSNEPGIDINWIPADQFLASTNTYYKYNTKCFELWKKKSTI